MLRGAEERQRRDEAIAPSGVRMRGGHRGAGHLGAGHLGARHVVELLPRDDEATSAWGQFVARAYLTGVRSLWLVQAIAGGVGAAMVLQTTMAPMPPSAELGRMLVVVVLRELAPLFSALVIAARAGTLPGEESQAPAEAARALGVEAARPLGVIVAAVALAIHFAVVAMLSAFLTSSWLTIRTLDAVREGFVQELMWFDLPLFVAKSAGVGAIIAYLVRTRLDRAVAESPARAATAASDVVVGTLFAGSVFSVGVTLALYAVVGPPPPP
jgi:phospholipid/cholesterol/gamma-HCH transport system permease protein